MNTTNVTISQTPSARRKRPSLRRNTRESQGEDDLRRRRRGLPTTIPSYLHNITR